MVDKVVVYNFLLSKDTEKTSLLTSLLYVDKDKIPYVILLSRTFLLSRCLKYWKVFIILLFTIWFYYHKILKLPKILLQVNKWN